MEPGESNTRRNRAPKGAKLGNSGGTAQTFITPVFIPRSLKDFVAEAPLIADGKVTAVMPSRIVEGKRPEGLETDFVFSITKVLKGDRNLHTVMISQIGGKAGRLEIATPQVPSLQTNRRYILFLHPDKRSNFEQTTKGMQRFVVEGVWSGIFEVKNGVVHPSSKLQQNMKAETASQSADEFSQKIVRLTRSDMSKPRIAY